MLPVSSGSLVAVAGTAALAGDAVGEDAGAPQTIRVMNFSDPAKPTVTKQFDNVTPTDNSDGLILLANADGVWFLTQHFAEDPAEEERYAWKAVYGEVR